MRLSDAIKHLEELKAKYGDIPILAGHPAFVIEATPRTSAG
jgi:hypothetical protein